MFSSTNNRPKVRTPASPNPAADEPLPHLKRDDPDAAAADKTNLPEAHRYNDNNNDVTTDAADPEPEPTPAPPTRLPLRV